MRHAHVGIAEQPQAQAARGLGQAWGEIDFASLQGVLEAGLVGEVAPGQVQLERLGQPVHQLDIGTVKLLQATVELGIGCLQHQADAQTAVVSSHCC